MDRVQVAFQYGQPPSEDDALGQQLQWLQMKVIDGYIWKLVYEYECYRIQTVRPSPVGQQPYCLGVRPPYLMDEQMLLSAVAAHLQQVRADPLIIGYWVLDDWISWDAGSARGVLIKIHQLIQQYTPGRPAICGFGGTIWLDHQYGWDDWIADNFSPQGCDRVGLYIYTSSIANTIPTPPDRFNWSMVGLLPAMFTSLRQRGWDITREPLIGIGQAFGGPGLHTGRYWITPSAKDIETQSRSFCEHGATGLTFYAWASSDFGSPMQTPMTSAQIYLGIRNGITACMQYWHSF